MSKKELIDIIRRIYETPDVMFVIEGEDSDLAAEIESLLEIES